MDIALGLGGIPKGHVIEVYGPETSGKTAVSLHMVTAEVQKEVALLNCRCRAFFRSVVFEKYWCGYQ